MPGSLHALEKAVFETADRARNHSLVQPETASTMRRYDPETSPPKKLGEYVPMTAISALCRTQLADSTLLRLDMIANEDQSNCLESRMLARIESFSALGKS